MGRAVRAADVGVDSAGGVRDRTGELMVPDFDAMTLDEFEAYPDTDEKQAWIVSVYQRAWDQHMRERNES